MEHIKRIAGALGAYGLDAILLTSPVSERYALDFYGEGLTLITAGDCRYYTDSRYIEAAQKTITGARVQQVGAGKSHLTLAAEAIRELGLVNVGFESDRVSVDALKRYRETLHCQLVPAGGLVSALRASKDADELALMRKAQQITDETFAEIVRVIRPGLTEQEVAARIVYELMRRGASKPSFDPIVAAGANGSMPHAIPGDTVLERGMFITMDFGCIYRGYCSDMTRTVALGEPTQEMRTVYDIVLRAQRAGIAAARADVPGSQMDRAARAVIDEAGYGAYFGHSFGHSLGIEIHESPNFSPGETRPMPVGAVVSAEPGIYLPGRFGVRIEDVVILTQTGCEDITASPKELLVL